MKKGYPSTVVTGNESKIQSVVFEVPDFQDGEKGKIISTTETLSFHLHVFKSWVYVEVAGKVLKFCKLEITFKFVKRQLEYNHENSELPRTKDKERSPNMTPWTSPCFKGSVAFDNNAFIHGINVQHGAKIDSTT